jgi:hypothetical protein
VIERGLISTGGTYQVIREPNGRLIRHMFHDKGSVPITQTVTTSTGETAVVYPPLDTTFGASAPSPSYGTHSSSAPHVATSNPPAFVATSTQTQSAEAAPRSSKTPLSSNISSNTPSNKARSSSVTSSSSPPHPTVQSTADFLRANSSLDLSYCPTSNTDAPRSSLIQYVTWDSDVAKSSPNITTTNSLTNKAEKTQNPLHSGDSIIASPVAPPPTYASTTSKPATTTTTTTTEVEHIPENSNAARTESASGSHKPSKALKQHLSHGGDKGLIDVFNPYDEL